MRKAISALTLTAFLSAQAPVAFAEPSPAAVERGVRLIRSASNDGGTWTLVNSLITASISTGLGILLATSDLLSTGTGASNEILTPLIIVSLASSAVAEIARGVYAVVADPGTVESANYLLEDREALRHSGLFFLRDRANAGLDGRIREGIAETTAAVGYGMGAAFLFASDVEVENKTIFGIIFAVLGVARLASGMTNFFKESLEERIYNQVMATDRPGKKTTPAAPIEETPPGEAKEDEWGALSPRGNLRPSANTAFSIGFSF